MNQSRSRERKIMSPLSGAADSSFLSRAIDYTAGCSTMRASVLPMRVIRVDTQCYGGVTDWRAVGIAPKGCGGSYACADSGVRMLAGGVGRRGCSDASDQTGV